MSSKFVSGGMLDKPNERDQAWIQAEQELEQRRRDREREEEGSRHDGKTLFEALQANRDAKEAAFQESIKLKHQFRALDDDEVDFLNSQAQKAKVQEQSVQQQTSEQLELFRQKQQAADKEAPDASVEANDASATGLEGTDWTFTKKRKRVKEPDAFKGLKAKRILPDATSTKLPKNFPPKSSETIDKKIVAESTQDGSLVAGKTSDSRKPALGLVSYDSEEED